MTKLSIIIPCYNCAGTLEDAVDSIYRQECPVPFDVTMVDDGSSDDTYAVMQKLAAQYPNIRLARHETNRGGGAARNTAVSLSDGEIIFCLDSDDMLGPDFLKNIVHFWLEKRCDGVGIGKSIRFRGRNIRDVAYIVDFDRPGEAVRFESLLDDSMCSLYSTFLITRAAFARSGGYPTRHGFDTQGLAFRFLCNGLVAYTCPNAVYHHRVEYHESYYLREANAGRINANWLQIFDEYLYIFREEIKAEILSADLYPVPGKPYPPEMYFIAHKRYNIFAEDYRALIALGRDGVAAWFTDSADKYWQYWLGSYHLDKRDAKSAIVHFTRALELGFSYRSIHIKMLEASLSLSGVSASAPDTLTELGFYLSPYPTQLMPFWYRIKYRVNRNRYLAPLVRFARRFIKKKN